jgi:hypothetical protein
MHATFIDASSRVLQQYEDFLDTKKGSVKWAEHSADEIAHIFSDAAVVIHDTQRAQERADLAALKKWSVLKRWFMELAQWRPCIVQTVLEIKQEMVQQCNLCAKFFTDTDNTLLAKRALAVAAKLNRCEGA